MWLPFILYFAFMFYIVVVAPCRYLVCLFEPVNCNLLILDEVFDSSLDGGGTEEFMKLITTMGNRSNIFVISHKSDQLIDKFSGQIKFEKKNNFSRIK